MAGDPARGVGSRDLLPPLRGKVRVRDCIVDRLNQALCDVSKVMNFDATVEVYGLPTLADVAAVKRDFHEDLRGLGEIVSATM